MTTNLCKVFFLAAVAICIIAGSLAYAQGYKPSTRRLPSKPPVQSDWLKEPPSLPCLPTYSGKATYLRGQTCVNRRGPQYFVTFNVKESIEQVMAWHEVALKNYGWKYECVDSQLFTAKHNDGHECTIMTSAPEAPNKEKAACSLRIVFQVVEQR